MAGQDVKITVDRKAQIFVEEMRKEMKAQAPKHLALYGGRIKMRIGQEIDRWAKDPSGGLAASFKLRIRRGDGLGSASLISSAPHAAIHEHGGTIRPVRAQALTVPITPTARRFKARFFPGNLIRIGKTLSTKLPGGRLRVHYLLRKQVRIRPKHYISKAMARSVADAEKTFKGFAVAVTESARRKTNQKGRRITL